MKKQDEFIEKLRVYQAYTDTQSGKIHDVPTQGTNCGAEGRCFEMAVKAYLGNYRSKGVAKAGYTDTRKFGQSIEIKSGCGELGIVNENGDIIKTVFRHNIIIYTPDYQAGDDVGKTSYVLTTSNFLQALSECELIRYKTSTFMSRQKAQGLPFYKDRIAIQSFRNSNRKSDLWLDALENYGISLEKWVAENTK